MVFSDIESKVALWLNRSDLTALIPDFVNFAQRDIERINWNCMQKRQTVSTDDTYLSYPHNFKDMKFLKYFWSDRYFPVAPESLNVALTLYPFPSIVKTLPRVFAIIPAQSQIMVRPCPDISYTYDMLFYAYTDALVNNSDSNWWTLNTPELLIYGALLEAEPYMRDDARLAVWQGKYDKSMGKLLKAEHDSNASGGFLNIRSNMPRGLTSRNRSTFRINEI